MAQPKFLPSHNNGKIFILSRSIKNNFKYSNLESMDYANELRAYWQLDNN